MKIVAAPADFGGCGMYRMVFALTQLQREGYDIHFTTKPDDPAIDTADVLILQRISNPAPLETMKRAKARGQRIIMDFDDDLRALPKSNPCYGFYGDGNKPGTKVFLEALKLADVVTCSTALLAQSYADIRSDMVVIENAVDDDLFAAMAPYREKERRSKVTRIGWQGSTTHRDDIKMVAPALGNVLDTYPEITLVFFGDDLRGLFRKTLHPRIEIRRAGTPNQRQADFMTVLYGLIGELDLDLALAPIEDNQFNRNKSACKVLEYGTVGYPVIASAVGPYEAYWGAAKASIVPCPPNIDLSWLEAMTTCIMAPALLPRVATENARVIAEHHLTSHRIPAWKELLA